MDVIDEAPQVGLIEIRREERPVQETRDCCAEFRVAVDLIERWFRNAIEQINQRRESPSGWTGHPVV